MRARSPRRVSLGGCEAKKLMAFRNRFTIFDYQRALLYRNGKYISLLEGGSHVRWGSGWSVSIVDMRRRIEVIGTQEILTQDGLGIRMSASCLYTLVDPRRAVEGVESYRDAAYLSVQLALRDAVTGMTAESLLSQRNQIGEAVTSRCMEEFTKLGLALERVELRDITFPGELKKLFAQVAMAQKEAQASLERARGEMASLRSLANAAKMLENNPALLQLRILQSLGEAKGATIVLNMADAKLHLGTPG